MSAKFINRINKSLYRIGQSGMILSLCFGVGSSPAIHAQEARTVTSAETVMQSLTEIPDQNYIPGQLIVKFKPTIAVSKDLVATSSSEVNDLLAQVGVTSIEPMIKWPDGEKPTDFPEIDSYQVLNFSPQSDISTAQQILTSSENIEFSFPNYIIKIADNGNNFLTQKNSTSSGISSDLTQDPNDTYYQNYQWTLHDDHLKFRSAWNKTTGSSDIIIAVLDTGLDINHPDIGGKNTGTGYNFISATSNIADDNGHGTLVSGLIAAYSNNSTGITGICWGCKIMPVKVCDSSGNCTTLNIINGMLWAANHGAKIINMSLSRNVMDAGYPNPATHIQQFFDYVYNKGVVVVASAGNNNENLVIPSDNNPASIVFPAAFDHVIAVGAVNRYDQRCNFSQSVCGWDQVNMTASGWGERLDVVAPGSTDYPSTDILGSGGYNPNGDYYMNMGGTSGAAPHVVGLAALILSLNPNLSPDKVENLIERNAVDLGVQGKDVSFGWGRIDAYASVNAVPTTPSPTPSPTTDYASFLSDITLPDGVVVSPGQPYTKTWRVKNTGTSTWGSGYQLAFTGGEQMGAPSALNVPTTAPGQTADISVPITAPTSTGMHTGYWQIRNPQGTYFGDKLWVKINVQTAGSHITVSADPPSPADTTMVRIHVLVNGFPNFRALRIKIDGNVQYEISALEAYWNWDTSSYSIGGHSIVVEVADQSDTSWSHPEVSGSTFTLTGTGVSNNHAPNRPSLVANPAYDWYVKIGSAPQLCAQGNGDPDGDAITSYRFVASASVSTVDSGWVGSSCYSFGSITPGTYEWYAQVKDNRGGISDKSDKWHFTVEPSGVTATIDHFSPGSPSNVDDVKIYACSSGHAGVNITLRVLVNDAANGTDSGQWHIIKEQGSPCFNDTDVPVWHTLDYADGPHLVRVLAWAIQPDAGNTYDTVYTLNHRRPASPRQVAPVPASQNIREAIYLNSLSVHFQWEPTIRAQSYTLSIGVNPSPRNDPTPVYRQVFSSGITQRDVIFSQPYPVLYWQVTATNDVGSSDSGDQLFGIDLASPACVVQSLNAQYFDNIFQVNWKGTDNLAGLHSFDIQYQDDRGGGWNTWLAGVPSTKTYDIFTGMPGHGYGFRCLAIDNANNSGVYPSMADTATKIDPEARPPSPWWNTGYGFKRNLTILNNMSGVALPIGYPVHLHFDSGTTPTAADLYNASLSSPKCNDLRIVNNDATELSRIVKNCSISVIDIWFRSQASVAAGSSDNSSFQLYYGNVNAGGPPANEGNVFLPSVDANTVAAWYMSEGAGGTLNDQSGNGHSCTIYSPTSWITSAKFPGALNFAGGSDSQTVDCGSSSAYNLQNFTFEFFFRSTSNNLWGRMAGDIRSNSQRWVIDTIDNKPSIWIWTPSGSLRTTATQAFTDNLWHHLAFTVSGTQVNLYIDGGLNNSGTLPANIRSDTLPLTVGSAENIMRSFAEITGVRLSNVIRTDFSYGAFVSITNEPSLAAGVLVSPPVTGSPDLAVLNLATYPNLGGGILVEAQIQNQGNLDTQNGFYTDLYVNHVPAGAGDYTGSLRFWVDDPIAAGATVTLTTVINDLSSLSGMVVHSLASGSETSGTLYAQVDSAGVVGESDKSNNIYSAGTGICIATADAYEGDNAAGTASTISLGQTQAHNFDRMGDQDWIKFTAQQGQTFILSTSNLGASADTYLYLYDTNGTTLLASNDDFGDTLASKIEWTAGSNGTYYVLVEHWNPSVGGCGTSYDFSISSNLPSLKIYLPLVIRQ